MCWVSRYDIEGYQQKVGFFSFLGLDSGLTFQTHFSRLIRLGFNVWKIVGGVDIPTIDTNSLQLEFRTHFLVWLVPITVQLPDAHSIVLLSLWQDPSCTVEILA